MHVISLEYKHIFAILKYSHSCFSATCYMYGIHVCTDHLRKRQTSLLPHIHETTIVSCLQLQFMSPLWKRKAINLYRLPTNYQALLVLYLIIEVTILFTQSH